MKRKNKSKLIIFRELENKALNTISAENLVLFGEKEFISDDDKLYDLGFHAVSGINLSKIKLISSLIIPVLKEKNNIDKIYLDMYYIAKQNPLLTKFCVSNGNDLIFYNLITQKYGKEIKSLGGYSTVQEKEFFDFVKNECPTMESEIEERKRLVNEKSFKK
tara:strand:- start:1 stop:486 length:486 start_codon:yes stop_codon:yes gene_type:complete